MFGRRTVTKLTPEQWLATEEFSKITVLDPDGWDRRNFAEDWKKPLTKAEFSRKLMQCTLLNVGVVWPKGD